MVRSRRFGELRLLGSYIRESLGKHARTAVALGALAVVLGAAPSVQSAIESNILDTLSNATEADSGTSVDRSVKELLTEWDVTIPGLQQFLPNGDISSGFVVQLDGALGIYAGFIVAIVLLEILSARLSAKIVRGYFVKLQQRGWSGALHATPGLERRLSEARRNALDEGARRTVDRNDDEVEDLSGYWSRAIQEGAEALSYTAVNAFNLGRSTVTFVTATFLIVQLGYPVLLAFLLVVAFVCLITTLQARHLGRSRQRLESEGALLSGRMNDALAHRDLIRAWEQTVRVRAQIEADAQRLVDVEQRLAVSATGYRQMSSAVFDAGRIAALVCFVAFVGVQSGSVVDVFLVSTLYFRLLSPIRQLTFWVDHWARTRATTQIFATVVEEASDEPRFGFAPESSDPATSNVIEFDNVEFSYPSTHGDVRRIFGGISFGIPRNKATLLVGRSGCGKTTISRMMMGFIAPTRGSVRVDGVDLGQWESGPLLEKFSYVSQGHNVLHGTVRDNLFNSSAQDDLGRDALNQLGLAGVDFDQMATRLSTGQQQRLALARLLLSNADVLILDEPTTGLDAFTMRELMPVLSELLFSGRTVVMITHRLVFAEKFDHVVMILDHVRLEEGAPPALLANERSEFHALYEFARDELKGTPM